MESRAGLEPGWWVHIGILLSGFVLWSVPTVLLFGVLGMDFGNGGIITWCGGWLLQSFVGGFIGQLTVLGAFFAVHACLTTALVWMAPRNISTVLVAHVAAFIGQQLFWVGAGSVAVFLGLSEYDIPPERDWGRETVELNAEVEVLSWSAWPDATQPELVQVELVAPDGVDAWAVGARGGAWWHDGRRDEVPTTEPHSDAPGVFAIRNPWRVHEGGEVEIHVLAIDLEEREHILRYGGPSGWPLPEPGEWKGPEPQPFHLELTGPVPPMLDAVQGHEDALLTCFSGPGLYPEGTVQISADDTLHIVESDLSEPVVACLDGALAAVSVDTSWRGKATTELRFVPAHAPL